MREGQPPKRIPIELIKPRVEGTHLDKAVLDIPDDSKSGFIVDFMYGFGDAFISINDLRGTKDFIFFPEMRFRSAIGGGQITTIAEELSVLPEIFEENSGQIPKGFNGFRHNPEPLKFHSLAKTSEGKKDDEFKYKVENIDADDQDGMPTQFLDIIVNKNGNVSLIRRDEQRSTKAELLFKTKKNGGKHPIIAKVFTIIAEQIIKAQKLRDQRTF